MASEKVIGISGRRVSEGLKGFPDFHSVVDVSDHCGIDNETTISMDDREGRKGLLSFKSRFAAKLEQMKDGNFGTHTDVYEEADFGPTCLGFENRIIAHIVFSSMGYSLVDGKWTRKEESESAVPTKPEGSTSQDDYKTDTSVWVNREEADDDRGKKQATDVSETKKNKTKKKKDARALREDEDEIDKILAELGEGPTVSAPSLSEEKMQVQPESKEAVESAEKKKKKKKKEKEKQKKAAAAATVISGMEEEKENDTKGKLADRKQSKQVKEMQERLKKMKEAEERKKKDEEERLRKEEEEQLRLEELERLAEEKKRLKKEREKEKLLKKKQEGKFLTGKQKEEARRLEAMRKQFLASGGALPLSTEESRKEATKRPIYQTKKSKTQVQANGKAKEKSAESTQVQENQQEIVSEFDSMETEEVEDMNSVSIEEKSEVADAEENGVEEDEEWDAKSWDAADLNMPGKSAFEDEEMDSDPQPIVKKEIKATRSAASDAAPLPAAAAKSVIPTQRAAPSVPTILENAGSKKREPENWVSEKTGGQSEYNLRSPICCIMGHVDTGKTKLLDCIRGTNVQEGEAGGITQQIGATFFPAENIRQRTKELKADANLKVPGLLVIDTPGHESFTNLRSRGSGLCDIAILVVDIMHGLERQTIESLNLLKMRNTNFIIALNKVDRLYGWKACRNASIVKAMKQQSKEVQFEFRTRLTQVITEFKEQGINTELYYKNKDMGKDTFSIVPTSAISGEGIPDLLLLLVQWTAKTMVERLTYSNEVQCTVLEVKVVEGHGTTIDVILVNGVLHEGDQIVVCGMQGPIVTSIRALLTPDPMKELRVKGSYQHHKEIKAAQGIKINAQGLEHAIAGTSLYVVGPGDDVEDIKEAAMEDMRSVGTPICIRQSLVDIGRIASIKHNDKPVDSVKKGQKVSIKIVGSNIEEQQKMFGRHFEIEDELVSKISRRSIDILKANFRKDLSVEDWKLVLILKALFKIQ
ncbi:hypothetical protein HAX54_037476 [Datura stramonium]|uniref:Tr-type G domain-containing protein n=1 Tax=Datura stramonium TaxID=4076 RepID=A0ABS8VKP5_DATST|nr:hypothetical protein [Datura stramonium]